MIPKFTQSGVLPPFLPGKSPSDRNVVAPYETSLGDLIAYFNTSDSRKNILEGFLNYRKLLKQFGINNGFQWIDGSFIEDCEKNRNRPPRDIDIITFAFRPIGMEDDNKWKLFFSSNLNIFNPKYLKTSYMCDAYFIDLNLPSPHLISQTSYWFGLFSHQRTSFIWKGMLKIDLSDDEDSVLQQLGVVTT